MFLPVQHDPDRSARFPGSRNTGSNQGIYLFLYLSSMILTGLPDFLAAAAQAAARGTDLDSLPPKPPPILFTLTFTLKIYYICFNIKDYFRITFWCVT